MGQSIFLSRDTLRNTNTSCTRQKTSFGKVLIIVRRVFRKRKSKVKSSKYNKEMKKWNFRDTKVSEIESSSVKDRKIQSDTSRYIKRYYKTKTLPQ